jgi:hypothetical protein
VPSSWTQARVIGQRVWIWFAVSYQRSMPMGVPVFMMLMTMRMRVTVGGRSSQPSVFFQFFHTA